MMDRRWGGWGWCFEVASSFFARSEEGLGGGDIEGLVTIFGDYRRGKHVIRSKAFYRFQWGLA